MTLGSAACAGVLINYAGILCWRTHQLWIQYASTCEVPGRSQNLRQAVLQADVQASQAVS
jgi:hypothetical protein